MLPVIRFVATLLALGVVTAGSTLAGQSGSTFRAGVDVVTVDVTVTDSQRRYVTDLQQSDFTIVEDGRPQDVRLFQRVGVPLAVSLLVDTSASMERSLLLAKEAAAEFVRTLRDDDVAAVIDFDSRLELAQPFTNDHALLRAAIDRMNAGGATALHNALYIATRELQKGSAVDGGGPTRRRAVVVLSDGEDTSSLMTFDEVLDTIVRAGIPVYAIGLGVGVGTSVATDSERLGQFNLRRLTQQTGGRPYFPKIAADLAAVYRDIHEELSSQYTLAYESDNVKRRTVSEPRRSRRASGTCRSSASRVLRPKQVMITNDDPTPGSSPLVAERGGRRVTPVRSPEP